MDEEDFGETDGPPVKRATGGDRATDELLRIPLPGYELPEETEASVQERHAYMMLVTRLAGSGH